MELLVQPDGPADASDGVGPLVGLDAAIDALFDSRLSPVSSPEANAAMVELDRLARRVHAAQLDLMASIDARALHRGDGFASVKTLARHSGRHSGGEALDRDRARRMLACLDLIAAAFRVCGIGIDQVHLLGRVHANPRVAGAMVLRQEWFLDQARRWDYRTFEIRVREWERLIDEDGPEPANERTHRNRDARIVQNPIDLSWDLDGGFAAMQGAQIDEIWRYYCIFIGCCVPASACEIDHLTEHSRGGRTNPGNGAPDCGMHNRFRQKGFTVYRDEAGHWHTLRPDGTEIP